MLTKLGFNKILIIAVVVLGFLSYREYKEIQFQKSEKFRQQNNYENLRDLDSTKNAILQFNSKRELREYINSKRELKDLLSKANIKLQKTESIVYIQHHLIDSLKQSHDVSPIIQYIREDVAFKQEWKDSTECLVVGGNLVYSSGVLNVTVTRREWSNKIAVVGGWKRNQWKFLGLIKTRIFGRVIPTATAVSDCGESETVILSKIKN